MTRQTWRRWMFFGIGCVILLALGVLLGAGVSTMVNDNVGPPVVSANGGREHVLVDNTADLLANIGRDDIELALAPGQYVVPACGEGIEEDSPTCGQMQQGNNSVLRSDLRLKLDKNGVPTGKTKGGAVIDCGELPFSPLEFSCLVAGDGSTIRNLTIRNGLTTPDPRGREHRNGIMIVAGKEAVVDEVRLINTRRGVVFTAESGRETLGVVRHSLIEGTELAGVFLWMRSPDGSGTSNSELEAEVDLLRVLNHVLISSHYLQTNPRRSLNAYVRD